MDTEEIIRGKKVLIVDDEEDILEALTDLLSICKIDTASSYEEGKRLIENHFYDIAILDIMGVKGFDLLKIARERGLPALMLTAHGLSEENLKRSAEDGASYYAPKDEIIRIAQFVADVLKAKEKEEDPWSWWFERLGHFYDSQFGGTDWREKEKEFWKKKIKPT